MPADLVSVIVPTCNRPKLLRRTLDSLAAQTLQEFKVVVVNDAGAPAPEIAREYPGLDLKYVEHNEQRGLGAARNTGIDNSRGRWLCYLDDDDTFAPQHLERMVSALRGGAKLAHSDYYRVFERRRPDGEAVFEEEVPEEVMAVTPQVLLVQNVVPVCCVVHERACLEQTGKFDETLPVLEDHDLWIRFMLAEFSFQRVAGATVRIHVDLGAEQMTAERFQQFPEVQETIYRRYAEQAGQVKGVVEEQRRYLMLMRWRARLATAFLQASGGRSTLEIELGDVIYNRGFMGALEWMLEEISAQVSGVYGKKQLLRQLFKEFVKYPVPSWFRK